MTSQSLSSKSSKRAALLQAGLELFVEHGFHGTPTSRIAERSGVSNGTLFHYFHNKDRLIVDIYRNASNKMQDDRRSGMGKVAGVRGILKNMWSRNVNWALQHPKMYYYIHQFEFSPYKKQFQWEESSENVLVQIFETAIKKRLIVDLPVDLLISLVENNLFSLTTFLEANPEARLDQNLMNVAFERLWRSIKLDSV